MGFKYNSKYNWVMHNLKSLDFVSELQLLKLLLEQATLTFIKRLAWK